MTADTDVRSELIQIIGYQGETCLPDEKPVMAFFTDRYLNPVLDGLVRYIEEIRADERERLRAQVARLDLLDIREDGVRGTTLVVRLDDVEALLGGESDE